MDAREILSGVPLFADTLSQEQLGFLASHSRSAFFRAGTRLMNQGDFGGAMFVITKGQVSVNLTDEKDRERTVATLGVGDIVGEMSLFTGDRRTASVVAASNVDALEITKWSLERVFARTPELVDRVGAVLAKRQAELSALSSAEGKSARDAFVRKARKAFAGLFGKQP
jgi:CRP-like cAMP-binding protein